jgi:ubiquinone/menaquinone biosynthesis C-methylase UbiE
MNMQSTTQSSPDWIPLFDEVASKYDQIVPFFSAFADRFAAWVQTDSGRDVLDIATGRGAIISALARLTGKDCQFIGIDLSKEMLRHTSDDFVRRGLTNVRFEQMDAENLAFPDESFDLITSGFAVHLLNDPAKAFEETFRTLRPGGHFTFSTPGPATGRCADFYDALTREFSGRIAATSRDQVRLRAVPMLTEAGFVDVETIEVEIHIPVDSPEAFWEGEMSHGRRRFFEQLAEPDLIEFRDRLFAFLEGEQTGGGIVLDRGAIFRKARKPGGRDESRR